MKERLNKDNFFDTHKHIQKNRVKKKQIVLINTGCSIDDHITRINFRYNKQYKKIPTFTIARSGAIHQHYDPLNSSQVLDNQDFDKQSIVIALENIGWLHFNEGSNTYVDWKGVIYENPIIEKLWRSKKYWAQYTDEQFLALTELIDYLCLEYSINKNFIGNNVTTHKPVNYKGILNRSNFSKNHYDLTPAFDFEKLTEIINK
jgi:hypothetical protein